MPHSPRPTTRVMILRHGTAATPERRSVKARLWERRAASARSLTFPVCRRVVSIVIFLCSQGAGPVSWLFFASGVQSALGTFPFERSPCFRDDALSVPPGDWPVGIAPSCSCLWNDVVRTQDRLRPGCRGHALREAFSSRSPLPPRDLTCSRGASSRPRVGKAGLMARGGASRFGAEPCVGRAETLLRVRSPVDPSKWKSEADGAV